MSSSPIPAQSSTRPRLLGLIACTVCLFCFALIGYSAWLNKSAIFDEPFHFLSGWLQTHYADFRCNPEDPPLWKYWFAMGTNKDDLKLDFQGPRWDYMLRSIPGGEVIYSDEVLYRTPGADPDGLLRAARTRMIFVGVAVGAVIGWWAWRLRGPLAGVVAVAAFAFDPNFLANTPIVKNDVPITLVFLLLMAAIWLLGERATVLRCVAILLLVGAALTTKFSGILAIPMLAIALFCRCMLSRPWPFLRWTLATRSQRLWASGAFFGCSLIFGYFFIWACYGFRFGPSPDPAVKFDFKEPIVDIAENEMQLRQNSVPTSPSLEQLNQWVQEWKPDLVVRVGKFINAHRLLPQSWLFGFIYTYGTAMARRAFLCGEIRVQGWWYYFPLAMLFKTPLATLIAIAGACVVCIMIICRKISSRSWSICALLIAPLFYMAVAMHGNLNIGLRHILPVYPFLFIFVGIMAAAARRRWPKIITAALVLLLAGLLSETVAAYPDYIPFFNVAAGGSRGGIRLLSDANLDWGQDLPALAQWQRAHPDRQLYLSQFALPDPRFYKISYIEMKGAGLEHQDEVSPSGLPPVYAISAVNLQGTYIAPGLYRDVYSKFAKMKPFEILNGTIYLFDHAPPP
jgi:hypothetical protein